VARHDLSTVVTIFIMMLMMIAVVISTVSIVRIIAAISLVWRQPDAGRQYRSRQQQKYEFYKKQFFHLSFPSF